MSLLFIDGFDDGLTSQKWTVNNGSVGAGGRTLNRCRFLDNSTSGRKTVAAADEHATFIAGFAFKAGLTPSPGNVFINLFTFLSDAGATTHISIHQDANNALVVQRGAWVGTTLGTTASNVITPGTYQYLEVKVVLNDVTGSVVIQNNGVNVLNLTNVDTKNGGTKTVFESFSFNTFQNGVFFDVDDFYLCNGAGSVNNTFLGDCSVLTKYPDGNGNYSQGTNSNGDSINNYSYVDEATPSTADYVAFPSSGNKDTYTFQNVPTGNILGVQQAMYAAKSDAGARTMRNIQRIGGVDFTSPDKSLPVSPTFGTNLDMMQVSPATGVLWTATELNAAEFGTEARP